MLLSHRRLLAAAMAVAIAALLAAACGGDGPIKDPQTITEEDAFTFRLPGDMEGTGAQGIDSIAGAYQGPSIRLEYDYGPSTGPLGNEGKEEFRITLLTIDGREATVERFLDATADATYPYVAAIHFADLGNGNQLTMVARCQDEGAQEVAMAVFRSIRFLEAGS